MRIRIDRDTRACLGVVLWGGPELVFPVLAGSVLTADRIELRDDTPARLVASNPCYVEKGAHLTAYRIHETRESLEMHSLDTPQQRAAFAAFVAGMGVEELSVTTQ